MWGSASHGPGGWIPESYLEFSSPTSAKAKRDYDAGQLTVSKGELLDVVEELDHFLRCRNAKGVEGWVPVSILEDVTGAP